MVRKADHNRALSGTVLDPVKGALSLAPRRWRGVVLMCLMAWLGGAACAQFAVAESHGPAILLLESVNRTREEAGTPPLHMNAQLNMAAMAQAGHLAAAGRLSHLGPDRENIGARLHAAGYAYAETAENLASGPADAARIVGLWQASPGHNRNMLNPAFSEAGIGHVSSHDADYWVIIFARPGGP